MECNLHDSFAIFSNVVDPFLLRSSSRTMSMSVTVKKYVWESVVKHTSNVSRDSLRVCMTSKYQLTVLPVCLNFFLWSFLVTQ